MISKFREWTLPIMLIILVSFVIGTIFLNWGMNRGQDGGSKSSTAGSINGKDVPLTYFDRELSNERQQLDREQSSENQYQMHMLPYQVWEKQVSQALLNDFFSKNDLYGTADEIFNYLKNNPPPGVDTAAMFLTNGAFDTAKFVAVLNDPRTYEYNPGLRMLEQQARTMIIPSQKLAALLEAAVLPTKSEVEDLFAAQNEKAVFEYACMKGGSVRLDPAAVTEPMLSKYYADNRNKFKSEEQVDLYFVKFTKKATARDEQSYQQELTELRAKLLAVKDVPRGQAFAEEAKVSSDDAVSAAQGGDVGFVKRGVLPSALDSVVFRLDSGAISEPVRTDAGLCLLYSEGRRTGKDPKDAKKSIEEVHVRQILRKIVPTGETMDALQEKADSLRRRMEDDGFQKAAREAALKDPSIGFDSTGFFVHNNPVPGVGYVSGLGQYLYTAQKGTEKFSERLENSDGFYLFTVRNRIPKGTLPYEAVKGMIARTIGDSLQKEAGLKTAEEWIARLPADASLAALSKADSATFRSGMTDTVSRMTDIPTLGRDSKVATVALALPAGKRSKVFEFKGDFYVVRTLWKGPAAMVPWGTPITQAIMGQMMSQSRDKIYGDWYRSYRSRQKITSNIDKVYID